MVASDASTNCTGCGNSALNVWECKKCGDHWYCSKCRAIHSCDPKEIEEHEANIAEGKRFEELKELKGGLAVDRLTVLDYYFGETMKGLLSDRANIEASIAAVVKDPSLGSVEMNLSFNALDLAKAMMAERKRRGLS